MKRLITICAVAGLIMAVTGTAQADLDIDGIYMTSCNDYNDGTPITNPWNFEIWVDFAYTDGLDHIDVTPPAGGLPPFTIYEGDGDWEYYPLTHYPTLAALRDDYPTGNYTFDFRDSNNTSLDSVILDYSNLSEPLNPVNFTYPAYDGQTGIPLNPTFTWTVSPTAGDALLMWVLDPDTDNDVYENVPASMDTTSWPLPGPLDPNYTYELEVSVLTVKDVEEGLTLPTMMTVCGDEFEYALLIEYCNGIEFTTVPEPATIVLLGFGSLTLLSRNRRFNKK